jgi:hypothetical protein
MNGDEGSWGNVPARDLDFAGREEQLAAVRAGLLAGGPVVVHAVRGMGGAGKSQVAIEYAHRHAGDYALTWWLDCENTVLLPAMAPGRAWPRPHHLLPGGPGRGCHLCPGRASPACRVRPPAPAACPRLCRRGRRDTGRCPGRPPAGPRPGCRRDRGDRDAARRIRPHARGARRQPVARGHDPGPPRQPDTSRQLRLDPPPLHRPGCRPPCRQLRVPRPLADPRRLAHHGGGRPPGSPGRPPHGRPGPPGPGSTRTFRAGAALAAANRALGRYGLARNNGTRILARRRSLHGYDHPGTLTGRQRPRRHPLRHGGPRGSPGAGRRHPEAPPSGARQEPSRYQALGREPGPRPAGAPGDGLARLACRAPPSGHGLVAGLAGWHRAVGEAGPRAVSPG